MSVTESKAKTPAKTSKKAVKPAEAAAVISSGNTPKEEYNRLQSEHEQGNKNFSEAKLSEDERQKFYKHDAFKNYEGKIEDIKDELRKKSKDLM
ncbi:hypothetical protein VV40_004149 [Salmonella enterica subsp. enterica serovar Pomona]|nr:hypothetical protein [Salmonella enterica subsp. enterica serovar Pomona]EBU5704832.1 hypothetical protein [Salmonella enterica]EBV7012863.1 hypothetical protein [Salmonella enterica subsp. enterica serovar Pomona]ECU8483182.1 hypothetical protein [Salmonella enterica subsp. enterica serovar Pomona]EDT8704066.1 hypothetical protein [Salmonella enterica subsp. enterica serovar Pomona]